MLIKRLRILLLGAYAAVLQAQEKSQWDFVTANDQLDGFNVAPASNPLNKALHDAAEYVVRFQEPPNAEVWTKRRKQIDADFRRALGLSVLPPRAPLNARVLRTHDLGDSILENVIFYSRPNFPVTANVYRPRNTTGRRLPTVIHAVGHHLELGKTSDLYQKFARKLVHLGFVVLVYDAIGHGERNLAGNTHHHAGFALLPLGETVAGWMVWDSMRAVDYLIGRPDVDPQKIGLSGNSGGGLNTLFTSAVEPRIKAASVAGFVFEYRTWMKYAGSHCTCVYLPGLYRLMEWFEVAGLTAPRAMLMLQGTHDGIFPLPAACLAGHATEALFKLLGLPRSARFDAIPNEPHGLSRPFREAMYGWMQLHLAGKGDGLPIPEGDIPELPVTDPRLLCDPDGSILRNTPSVVELARRNAEALEQQRRTTPAARAAFLQALVAPRQPEIERQNSRAAETEKLADGAREKIIFLSEIGEYIPAILWRPNTPFAPVVLIAHSGGKAAVAQSNLVTPLLHAGYAVFALDLRGRGETLGQRLNGRDSNYHLVSHSIMWGRPLAGRRAFDLTRAVDYLSRRTDLSTRSITAVGIGDDALPTLLAASVDPRIARVASVGYDLSFTAQMIQAPGKTPRDVLKIWNSSVMNNGRLNDGKSDADSASIVPGVLQVMDLPDFAHILRERPLLFSAARNLGAQSSTQRVATQFIGT